METINLQALRCQLSIHEGVKNIVYKDTMGLLTGGIGHLLLSTETKIFPLGTKLSDAQINTWYQQDSQIAINAAQSLLGSYWSNLSEIRMRAIADLAFNLGKSKLSGFIHFLSAMKCNNFLEAGHQLQNSIWWRQVGRRGTDIYTMIVNNNDPLGCDQKYAMKGN